MGRDGGSLPQEASPFVAALATLRRSGAGDRPNLGRNTWAPGEGKESRTHNPSHPIPPSDRPASPRFLFPRIRTSERNQRGHHSAGLVLAFCQSVFASHSAWSIVFFPFFFWAFSYLACIQTQYIIHSIRVDCFTFACAQLPSGTTPLGPHSDPSYCFSPTHPPSPRPTHSISITIDRAGTGCAALDSTVKTLFERETQDRWGNQRGEQRRAENNQEIIANLSSSNRLHRVIYPALPSKPPSEESIHSLPATIYPLSPSLGPIYCAPGSWLQRSLNLRHAAPVYS